MKATFCVALSDITAAVTETLSNCSGVSFSPVWAQTRASRCRFAFLQLTVHVRCLSYVLTTRLSHSPALKRAFQTKFPEAWRSNLPFLPVLDKVQVFIKTAGEDTRAPQWTLHYPTTAPNFVLCIVLNVARKLENSFVVTLKARKQNQGQWTTLKRLCSIDVNFLGNEAKVLYSSIIYTF